MLDKSNVFAVSRQGYELLNGPKGQVSRSLRRFLMQVTDGHGDQLIQSFAYEDGYSKEQLDALEVYAGRIEAMLAKHITGFKASIIKRRCYSPADLETMNVNLVGGDPYGGSCTIDQFFLWRPLRGAANHETPVKRLYHIGASTHPGPGLGGGSGFLLASALN